MKTIKVRYWNKEENRFYYSELEGEVFFPKGKPIGLFTGLKDKNGKEIFEGDVVERWHQWPGHNFTNLKDKPSINNLKRIAKEHTVFAVECKEKPFRFYGFEESWFKTWSIEGSNHGACDIYEIIGNIYENPELLKGKDDDGKGMGEGSRRDD